MAEIHIVGTAHVSQKSVNEVLETVDLVNPDVIAIELDQGRFATLKKQMKEEEDAKAGIVSEEADGKAPEVRSILSGNFMLMIFAIILLVFGHGLNMILNVLSVVVHGIRLNTLEFSTHLDMAWSGHKFKPFEE